MTHSWRKRICTVLIVSLLAVCATFPANNIISATASASAQSGSRESAEVSEPAGNFNPTGMPIVNEPLKLSMMVETSPTYTIRPEMWYFREMEKLTGINFEIENVLSDQWAERKSLVFASQQLPDVLVSFLQPEEIITYAGSGQLIALNNLLEQYAPNYMALLDMFPESAKLYAPDGNMYGVNGTFVGGYLDTLGGRCFINVKWLEEAGLDMPQTYDEFYKALVAFKARGEDVIPLTGIYDSYAQVDPFVAGPLGIPFSNGREHWMLKDGKVTFVAADEIYIEFIKRMKQLYDEGLLDQEYYTQNEAQLTAKGMSLTTGAFQYYAHFVMTGSTDPESYAQYEIIEPMTSEFFDQKVWYGDAVRTPNIFITNTNEHPEATVRYLDYAFTGEGSLMFTGPNYGEWDGEGGLVWNDDGSCEYITPEGYNGMWDYLCKEVAPLSMELQGYSQFGEVWRNMKYSPEDASFKSQMRERIAPYIQPRFPQLFFTIEERDEVALILDEIIEYSKQMEVKFVTGVEPIENHSAYVETLNSMGLVQLTEMYQRAYDRYMSNT